MAEPKKTSAKRKTGPKKPTGRPSTYTPKIAEEFCRRVMAGESVRSVCLDPKMPDRITIYRWIDADREGFRNQYARALEVQADNDFDRLQTIARQAIEDPKLERALRLVIDTDKWVMSKKLPKKYGDRQTIEHTGGVTFSAPNALDD